MLSMLLLCALAQPVRLPVLIDTDFGTDLDDAFALGLALASPELDVRGVTTVGTMADKRALMISRFLTMSGRRAIPIAAGADPQPSRSFDPRHQYYYHPDVLFNRTFRPVKESAVEFLFARLKASTRKTTLIALGPMTNIARLLKEKPESKPLIERILMTGGAANQKADEPALRVVVDSGIKVVDVGKAGLSVNLNEAGRRRVFSPGTALTRQMECLYQIDGEGDTPLADALTVALAVGQPLRAEGFIAWYVERLSSCVPPDRVPVKAIERGLMPQRVHVAEDFETDIERRWWLVGKTDTHDVPPGSRRSIRGVLTHDFDDLLGHSKAMHSAVVFNPVPGPPMGPQTRLSFRYKLKGTDTLRVQIYSLTNGYHRHLVLKDLPQHVWREATVDMTKARRPDGTGGPLSGGERIDDIQFYTDPSAELRIDDIVLFDAALKSETQPFPRRILYTGWFDSGKQGQEWPGDFTIAVNKGAFWHAAATMPGPTTPWVRLDLRGQRPVGLAPKVTFRYRLTGTDRVKVTLVNRDARYQKTIELTKLTLDKWSQTSAEFRNVISGTVDELRLEVPLGGEALFDDVLIYEP